MSTTRAADLIGSLAVYFALAAAVIASLDWFLREPAKSKIRDVVERIWIWLDDQRVGRLLFVLHNSKVVRWVLFGFSIAPLPFIAAMLLDRGPLVVPEAVLVVRAFLPGASVAFGILALAAHSSVSRLVAWIVARKSPTSTLARLTSLCAAGISTLGALLGLMAGAGEGWSAVQMAAAFFGLGFFGAPTFVLTLVALSMAAWLLALGALAIVLRAVASLALRLAEYPKGPVLGASVLLGAVGGVLKGLSWMYRAE